MYEFRMFCYVYPNDQKIHLILDSYSSQTSKISQITAKDLNIGLYFIPSHFTDLMQPWNIAIFAPHTGIANGKIRRLRYISHIHYETSEFSMEKKL